MSFKAKLVEVYDETLAVANHAQAGYEPYRALNPYWRLTGHISGSYFPGTNAVPHRINIDYKEAFLSTYLRLVNHSHDGGWSHRGVEDFRVFGSNSSSVFSTTDPTVLTNLTLLLDDTLTQWNATLIEGELFHLNPSTSYRYYVIIIDSYFSEDGGLRRIEFGEDVPFIRDPAKKIAVSVPPQDSELIDFPFLLNISENMGTTDKDISYIFDELMTESQYAIWVNGARQILSNNDKSIKIDEVGPAWGNVDLAKYGGKFYFEMVAIDSHQYIGIGYEYGVRMYDDLPSAFVYYGSGYKVGNSVGETWGSAFSNGSVIGVAVDLDDGKIWFSKNGVWQESGDPANGTNPAFTGIPNGAVPFLENSILLSGITPLHSEASELTYTPPSGFEAGFYSTPTFKPQRISIVDEATDQECCGEIEYINNFDEFIRKTPPAYSSTYVKANEYNSNFQAYMATEWSDTLIGSCLQESWVVDVSVTTSQKFNIDYGTAFIAKRLYLENYHDSGLETDRGIKNFIIYGTNSATAFANLTYSNLDDLTMLGSFEAAAHVASNVVDPQYFNVYDNKESFRYYILRISTNYGDSSFMGARLIEVQSSPVEMKLWTKTPSLSDSLYRTFHIYHDVNQIDNTRFIGTTSENASYYKRDILNKAVKGTAIKIHDLGALDDGNSDLTDYGTPAVSNNYYTFNGTNNGLYRSTQLGDTSNQVCFVRVRIHDKNKGPAQVIWKNGGGSNGIAVGIDASGDLGIFGRVTAALTSIVVPNGAYSNDVWYDIYFTKTKIVVTYSDTGLLAYIVTGTCTAGNFSAVESVAFNRSASPITGSTTADTEWFDGDIAFIEIYTAANLTPPLQVTSSQGVWDNNYVFVSHQAQDPSGTAPQILDSTRNAKHGTSYGTMLSEDLVDGPIGKALNYDGTDDYTNHGYVAAHNITDTFTLEAIIKPSILLDDSLTGYVGIISRQSDPTDSEDTYALLINPDGQLQFGSQGGNSKSTKASWAAGTDFMVAGTYDYNSGSVIGDLFVDGTKEVDTGDGLDSMAGSTNNLAIGKHFDAGQFFPGIIDEVRISNIVRSDDWIVASELAKKDELVTFTEPWDEDKKIIITIPPQESELVNFPVLLDLIEGGLTNLDMSVMLDALKEEGIDIDFDPDNKDVKWTAYGNYVAAHTGANGWADCATLPALPTDFLYYFEAVWTGGEPNFSLGFCPSDYDFTSNVSGFMEGCWTVVEQGMTYNPATTEVDDVFAVALVAGDVIGFAANPTTGKVWISKNGVFEGTQDPEAGIDAPITGVSPGWLFGASCFYVSHTCTLYTTKERCAYEPPEGFSYLYTTDKPKKISIVDLVTGNQCYCEQDWNAPDYDAATKLLICSDNVDGSINIIDSSPQNHEITIVSDAHHSTDDQKFGDSAIYFDGVDDCIEIPNSDDWTFGTNDFTIDFWINTSGGEYIIAQMNSAGQNSSLSVGFVRSASGVNATIGKAGTVTQVSGFDSIFNRWAHVATVMHNHIYTMYIDGVISGTPVDMGASAVTNSSSKFVIGRYGEYVGSSVYHMKGYIDQFRVSQGIARWTENFTPDTVPYAKTTKNSLIYTRVPKLSAVAPTTLNLFYDPDRGDNDAYIGNVTEAAAQQVWDENFVFVAHQEQDPSGSAPQMLDSTKYSKHGTSYGSMLSGALVDGVIGKALAYDGTDDYTNHGYDAAHDITNMFTLEAVVIPSTTFDSSLTNYPGIISRISDPTDNQDTYAWYFNVDGKIVINTGGSGQMEGTKASWAADTAFCVVATYNVTGLVGALFVDGTKETLTMDSVDSMAGCSNNLVIGKVHDSGNFFPGTIDEVRISNTVRSDNWLATTYLSNIDALVTFSFPSMGVVPDRNIPAFSNFPKPYNTNFLPDFIPSGLIRQYRKGFSKAF